jgi:peptidylprolyl isomerase
MASSLVFAASLLITTGAQADDMADRSGIQGFLSKYTAFESDASQSSAGDFDKFITPNLKPREHGDEVGPGALVKALGSLPGKLPQLKLPAHPTAFSQDPMSPTSGKGEQLNTKNFESPMITDKEEEKAVQQMLTDDNIFLVPLSILGAALLSFAAMLGFRIRSRRQAPTVVASNAAVGSDMSVAMTPASGENVVALTSHDRLAVPTRGDFLRVAAATAALSATTPCAYAAAATTTASGLSYELLKANPKGSSPVAGDLIAIRFKGSFDGNVFDDITATDEPLYYRVGSNSLIKGIEEVLPLMHLYEKVGVKIPAKLAFGDAGRKPSPGKGRIPSGADLYYEIEIVSFPGKEGDIFLQDQ